MALGRLRPHGVRPAVERLLDHPQALVRREANERPGSHSGPFGTKNFP